MKIKEIPECPILPLGDRVVIWRIAAAEKKGAIFVPEGAKDKPNFGVVIGLGSEAPPRVEKHMLVIFGKYSGVELEVGGNAFLVMRPDEILAIVADGKLADDLLHVGA